jgi:adenine-specific DNA-methyltransferase
VFGESNLIANFTIASNSAKNNAKFVSVTHEYLVGYAANKNLTPNPWAVKKNNLEDFKSVAKKILKSDISLDEIHSELLALVKYPKYYEFDHYTYTDKRGPFRASDLTAPSSTAFYDIIHPITKKTCKHGTRGWSFSKVEMQKLIEEGKILFGSDENTIPQLKTYLSESEKSLPRSILFFDSQASTKWMKAQKLDFPFPKALEYIKYILSFYPKSSYTILDFFAGSGTTLHATMQLNAEDGGHRQCILVTNNENGICENVTYERNKRVIEGYKTPKDKFVEGLHHNNLRYYKTDFVPRERTMKNMRALVSKATDMLCIKEDLYQEVPEFGKLKLPKSIARHFTNGIKEMLIIYREECIDELVDVIMDMDFEKKLKVYVFSPDRDPFEDEFEEVEDKVETCALPAAIYDAYIHVLSKRKDKPVEIAPESEKDYENEEWDINDGEDEV